MLLSLFVAVKHFSMKSIFIFLFLFSNLLHAQGNQNFVQTNKMQFTIAGKPYYYIGTNYWYGGLLALQQDSAKGKERLIKELDFMQSQGVNNLRVLVGAEGTGIINGVKRVAPALQPEQGIFREENLHGIDFLLTEMSKRNMKAVLYVSNNWEWSGGFLQYLNWNGLIADSTLKRKPDWDELRDQVSKFYFCDPCKAAYEKQVRFILAHTNIYSGLQYINDPAIMSWEIANEPRPMRPAAIADYKKWIHSVSTLIKSIDKNHLLTIGTEGTIGTENNDDLYEAIHKPALIDYLTIHIWPKNWAWFSDTSIARDLPAVIQKTTAYIQKHEQVAAKLQKPLVIEEFGLPRDGVSFAAGSSTRLRDIYFKSIFDMQQKSIAINGAIAGVNFWAFGGTARPKPNQLFWNEGDDYMGDPPQEEQGLNAVFDTDHSTWNIIRYFTGKLKLK